MAMDDRRDGFVSTTKTKKVAASLASNVITWRKTIDCADEDVTSADNVQLLYVPAGYLIMVAGLVEETAEGGTLTVDLGLYAEADDSETDKDGFLDGVDCNATAGTAYCSAPGTMVEGTPNTITPAYAKGGYYVSAGQNLCATFNNAADTAKITFFAVLVDLTK